MRADTSASRGEPRALPRCVRQLVVPALHLPPALERAGAQQLGQVQRHEAQEQTETGLQFQGTVLLRKQRISGRHIPAAGGGGGWKGWGGGGGIGGRRGRRGRARRESGGGGGEGGGGEDG